MANLKFNEKQIFEKLFDNGGYVLDFSNRTFEEFFQDFNISIYSNKYSMNGDSKMKRLRAFWTLENDKLVGKVLENLLELANNINEIEIKDYKQAQLYINKLQGKKTIEQVVKKEFTENDFLKQEFSQIDISLLKLDYSFEEIIKHLINVSYEIKIIKLDIKKFSHTLKDFRNYIHPRQQASQNFNPDKHTAEISWKVLQATIANLIGDR